MANSPDLPAQGVSVGKAGLAPVNPQAGQGNNTTVAPPLPALTAQQVLALIESRQSVGQLSEPAPSQQAILHMIAAAIAAPDHHRLRPWRFLQISGAGRERLGAYYEECLTAQGITDGVALARARAQPLRAPLILMAILHTQAHPKVPVPEQVLSMGAAVQNMLLMLHAQGYAAIWRTGQWSESDLLKEKMGLQTGDEIAGFIYVGTAVRPLAPRERLPVEDFLTVWPAAKG